MATPEQTLQFQQLVEPHRGILLKVARAYCPAAADRQDLVQEMLMHLWLAFPTYTGPARLSTWVYRVALNVAISAYRRQAVRTRHYAPFDEQLPVADEGHSAEHEAQLAQLEQFIAGLNELDKALMLLYLDDKPHADIAEILGLSVSNVATRLGRVRAKLKQKFNLKTA